MKIYKNRYQAMKERRENKWHTGDEKIIKVCGGYTLMTPEEYRIWKNQK